MCCTEVLINCPPYTKWNCSAHITGISTSPQREYQIQRETTQYNAKYDQIFVLDSRKIKKNKKQYVNKGNNKITELRTILQRESQNS
jgi:hypothetical protein